MADWFTSSGALEVVLAGTAYFAALYVGTAALLLSLTQAVLPRLGFGRTLDPRPLPAGQIARELRQSAVSIAIFGIGLLLPWSLLQAGWARLAHAPSALQVAGEVVLLFLWNELHFYAMHRLLHARALRRFHADHHRSHTPTPWSTYAFHPVEAALLGSVPLLPMLLHDFSFVALACLPVLSILLNGLGHANYEFSRSAPARGALGASRRHALHHAHYQGNYGFLLTVFDRVMRTQIALEDPARDRAQARHRVRG